MDTGDSLLRVLLLAVALARVPATASAGDDACCLALASGVVYALAAVGSLRLLATLGVATTMLLMLPTPAILSYGVKARVR